MKAIYGYEKGDSTEARVCTERWLAILCQKKNQPDSFGIRHGRNSQLPGLVAADTSNSTQHLFQVREKSLESTCASALPQSHLPATTLLSCLSTFKSAQDAAFLLHNKDLKPCILYTSGLAPLAGRRCQQTASARLEGLSPLPTRADHTLAFLQTHTPAATAWRPSCSF